MTQVTKPGVWLLIDSDGQVLAVCESYEVALSSIPMMVRARHEQGNCDIKTAVGISQGVIPVIPVIP